MKLKYNLLEQNIEYKDVLKFLNSKLKFVPNWYAEFLMKFNGASFINEMPHKKYGGYEYLIESVNQKIGFDRLYGFLEMKSINKNRVDLYPNTVLIGEEIGGGYFFIQVINEECYKIGFWDTNYDISPFIDTEKYDEMNINNVYYLSNTIEEFLNIWVYVYN